MTILNQENTKTFFDKFNIIAFPIANPDGVDLGHWRHNAHGVDLNRDWFYYNQPEIKNITSYIKNEITQSNSKLILGLDFHSTWEDVFYTNKEKENTVLPHFIEDWFERLNSEIPNYVVNEKSAKSKYSVSKAWFLNNYNATGITYEIGDDEPSEIIKLKSSIAAKEMMKILLKTNIN